MQFLQLKKKIENLKGIYGLLVYEDLVINTSLEIYMKKRERILKPHLKLNERVLIHALPIDKISSQITHEAIQTILAIYDSNVITEEFLQTHDKEIKQQIKQHHTFLIKLYVDNYNEIQYTQTLYSLGFNKSNVDSILNPTLDF